MAISSAITLYKGNKSSALSKPTKRLTSGETVSKKSVNAGREMRRTALLLLRKRRQRDRLEQKYFGLLDKQKQKRKTRNEENKQEQTSFLGSVGSGIKGAAQKLGGNLFGAIGDLLGFLALNWIADPSNQKTLTGIVKGLKAVLKFIDWFVTGSVDNFFTGFDRLIAGDSILDRVVGFFQMLTGAVGIFYALNPLKAVKDAFNLVKGAPKNFRIGKIFAKKWKQKGLKDALKFLFPKQSKVIYNITTKLSNTFRLPQAKELVRKVLKKVTISGAKFLKGNSIVQAISKKLLLFAKSSGGKGVKTALRTITKPFKKFVNKVPLIGPFLSVVINRAFGDPWDEAIIKAMGAGLGQWMGAGLGTLIFPGIGTFLGGLLGGLIGDWLGGRIYQFIKDGKDGRVDPVSALEKSKARALKKAMEDAESKGLKDDEATKFVEDRMDTWKLNNLKQQHMMLREWQGVTADQTEIDITGKDAMKDYTNAYIKIGDEVMKVIKSTEVKVFHTARTYNGKLKNQWNTLEVVRGWGGTKASEHRNASFVEFLGSNDPIKSIINGKYVARTNDLENSTKNQLLNKKLNNNGNVVAVLNSGPTVTAEYTNINNAKVANSEVIGTNNNNIPKNT